MGRPRTLLTLAVIFLVGARAAQRRKTTQHTGQAAHQLGSTLAAQTPPIDTTNATGRVISLWTMIGTVLAGIAALAALVVSYMTFTIQQQQNDDQQQRRVAGFASKVTWWTEHTTQDRVTTLTIQNSSHEPMPASIEPLILSFRRHSLPESSTSPAHNTPQFLAESGQMQIGLPPCSISRLRLTFKDRDSGSRLDLDVARVVFVDPAGIAWSRERSGLLARFEGSSRGRRQIEFNKDGDEVRIVIRELGVTLAGNLSRTSAPYCSGPVD
ncbi:hypothetical protein GCM10018953_48120 [Streptosporangium nondiastaticum]|uniref:hypothetical protein n=1 Tax=Streptosporangium nondiastaticum TaxID=35764 RepID=UPI0031F75967